MSDVDFLVGEKVVEIRYGLGIRIVFEAGDTFEPALYADFGRFAVVGCTRG
jgi:hypothetical protein